MANTSLSCLCVIQLLESDIHVMFYCQLYLHLYLFTCYCPLKFGRRKYGDSSVRTLKVMGKFCMYMKVHGALLCATGKFTGKYNVYPLWIYNIMIVLGEVLPMFGMTIQSYDRTRGSNTRYHTTIRSYDHTRSALRPIYDLMIILGY